MTTATESPGNGFAAVPNDLAGVEHMCEQLYTAQDATTRQQAESTLLSLAASPRHLSQCTMILENSEVSFLASSHSYSGFFCIKIAIFSISA